MNLYGIFANGKRELNDAFPGATRANLKELTKWADQRKGDGYARIEIVDPANDEVIYSTSGDSTEEKMRAVQP